MRPTAPERGFTLLESLTAGAIFFLVVVAVSLLTIQGSNNAAKGMRYAQASRVATQEMERFSMRGWNDLGMLIDGGVQPFVVPPYTITEQPDGGGRRYDVVVSIIDTSGPPGAPGERVPLAQHRDPHRVGALVSHPGAGDVAHPQLHHPGGGVPGHLCQPVVLSAASLSSS